MTPNEYVALAVRTESQSLHTIPHRVLHASMGLVTEAAEFQDALKKALFYGKEVDYVNLSEELGDILWYVALAVDAMKTKNSSITLEGIMQRNIEKLKTRYPDRFSEYCAINRDLEGERKVLEK